MGNSGSGEARPDDVGGGARTKTGSSTRKAGTKSSGGESTKRLLDYYTVGEMLGQGTFGVVYACKPKGQDRECAVKMVDKVETPVEKIKEEAEFLRKMNHPNVIKCYDVIYEKCFVCIVMDRLKGGDLILGMQAHWKATGRIPFTVSSRIAGQMAASLNYLHSQWMIHRDIKGDNYLTDRKDITDPMCRVVLTDFGTGMTISPGQRLHEKCGTKLYWSPEFFKLNYSLKVDVWAMGVVCYGLLCGRFPFRNEAEANKKSLSFSSDTPPEAQDLARKMLDKTEEKRASAQQVHDHPFVAKKGLPGQQAAPAAPVEPAKVQQPSTSKEDEEALMKEGGANEGVKDRRFELVERLMNAQTKMQKVQSTFVKAGTAAQDGQAHFWNDAFSIVDKRQNNSSIRYEWWTPQHVNADLEGVPEGSGVTKLDGARALKDDSGDKASVDVIKKQLEDHGIDTSAFGRGEAKTLEAMAREVQNGSANLMLDATEHKKLVRVVDVVLLRICAPDCGSKYLVEMKEQYPDGRVRSTNRLPGTKKDPHENTKQVAERIVREMMDLQGAKISFDFGAKEVFEEEDISPSYPGVCCVYRKEIVEGHLEPPPGTGNESFSSTVEWKHTDPTGNTKFFRWLDEKKCEEDSIQYKKPADEDETSALVQAPIGLNEEDLTVYLKTYRVDVTQFGQGKARTLQEFSAELLKGESSLCHGSDGSIIRVVDVVLLRLHRADNGKILVQSKQTYPDGQEVQLNRLPGTKRRPDENQFLTARTIVARQLKINDNHVTCSAKDVQAVEEEKTSLAYPGLRTVYRKRIISATLSRD